MSQPFLPEIRTKRLTLRPFQKGDAQDLYEYLSDPEVVRFEPYRPYTLESCGQEAENRSTNPAFIAVVLGDKVIGNVYLAKQNDYTWEVGWVFNRAFQHHGYATEAAHAAMDWAFWQQSAHRIIAMCDPCNPASWKLMERLGMRREGEWKKNVFFFRDENGNPLWKDTYQYAVLAEEWK